MNKEKTRQLIIARRKARILVKGTADAPRLCVFRSSKAIYAQIINDEEGKTIVAASSSDIKNKKIKKTEIAAEVGRKLAEKAREKGVTQVVFDRNGYQYHGRIKSLADGAREGGLKF